MPAADWPILPYGNKTHVGMSRGIFFASTIIRLLLLGTCGARPSVGLSLFASGYQRKLSGWPTKPPLTSCFRPQAPFQGPWLSVKKTSPAALKPTPPGERTPLVVGMNLPSGVTLPPQPRNFTLEVNEPVRHRAIQILPSLSKREPSAYS